MNLTETKEIDKIEVLSSGHILVREATKIFRGEQEVSTTYHRTSYSPGADLSAMPEKVRAIAEVSWTPDVVNAFNAAQEAVKAGGQS